MSARTSSSGRIAVVGMACRYPDADDPGQLWDSVLNQRRAFRRMPVERLALADYHDAGRTRPDSLYGTRVGVLEGWEFDRAAFRVPGELYRSADPAHWLALETAARALADAGFPEGEGLDRDRVAVVVGNSLTGEVTRAHTLRLRWPYVRSVLAGSLAEQSLPADIVSTVLAGVEKRFLEPFTAPNDETLAGSLANTIAGRICNQYDFHGGGFTVDGACASSLLAVISACGQLRDASADFVLAGGVDISLDPFELVGFARLGALAADRMRIYDERATGFIPGEGCGMVALMRAEDAAAAGLPVYAEILGWGVSSDGAGGITRPEAAGQLLALRRAYAHAGIEPARLGLVEGHGTGTAVGDAVELRALTELCQGANTLAALGSVKANIGHTKAAAGIAGLIKASWSVATGILPPATGCERPRPELCGGQAVLRVLDRPELWPEGPRVAGVSAMGFGGINTHLVLAEPGADQGPARPRAVSAAARTVPSARARPPQEELFLVSGADRGHVADRLRRLAANATRFSESELQDLACAPAGTGHDGAVRVALIAGSPETLARRAAEAADLLGGIRRRTLATRPGVWIGEACHGRVALLFPGQGAPIRSGFGVIGDDLARWETRSQNDDTEGETLSGAAAGSANAQLTIHQQTLAGLRWLERLGVSAVTALGHSLGEFAALVWAGVLDPVSGARLVGVRGRLMAALSAPDTGMLSLTADASTARELCIGTDVVIAAFNGPWSHVVAGSIKELNLVAARAAGRSVAAARLPVAHAFHSPAVAPAATAFEHFLRAAQFARTKRPVFSAVTGRVLDPADDVLELLVRQMTAPVRFHEALEHVCAQADLLCEIGPGRTLAALVADGESPCVSLDVGADGHRARAETAAALYASGALTNAAPLFAGRAARPIDPWRERVFIGNPCAIAPGEDGEDGEDTDTGLEDFVDLAERVAVPAPAPIPAPEAETGEGGSSDVPAVVLRLVAQATELSPDSLDLSLRLLSDLHLSSLKVAQLVAECARAVGREAPAAPLTLADASIAEMVELLKALPVRGDGVGAGGVCHGVGPWIRCFTDVPHVVTSAATSAAHSPADRPGRVRVAAGPLSEAAASILGSDPRGRAELLYLPEPDAPGAVELLLAVSCAAVDVGRLILVTHGSALTGFAGSLHREHPELGITVLEVPASPAGLEAGGSIAAARPGRLQRLVVHEDGSVHEPESQPYSLPGAAQSVLSVGDVLLVSGGGKGIGYECAARLAERDGLALGLVGRSDPARDAVLRRNLDRLAGAGIRFAYQSADIADQAATARAVAALIRDLGPISGILHAAGSNVPRRFADLTAADVRAHLAPKSGGFDCLLAAVDRDRIRLLITFGSVIGRHGMPGECHYALANGLMRERVERLAEALPGCRTINVDWSVWSGAGMGERLGVLDQLLRHDVTPIAVHEGVELFLALADAPDLPSSVAVHGRLGLPPQDTQPAGRSVETMRFLETIRVHYRGVELVAEARISTDTDPYLRDHQIDGALVLPAVVGLEAMAEAACALAGRPLRLAADIALDHPVLLDGDAPRVLRLCALIDGDAVTVALRSDETGFRTDHFTARFPLDPAPHASTAVARIPGESGPGQSQAQAPDAKAEDLYGPLYFHRGVFRRVHSLHSLRARQVRVRILGDKSVRWFTGDRAAGAGLLLGGIGCNDAAIHALQACVPHRRVLPVGCEAFWASGETTGATVDVHAHERSADGGVYVWDLDVVDGAGILVACWRGLRLKDVGPLPRETPWPPGLFGVLLERGALALGLDRGIGIEIIRRSGGRTVPTARPPRGMSRSHCGALTLQTGAGTQTAVDWQLVRGAQTAGVLDALGAGVSDLWAPLRAVLVEPEAATAARLWTVSECLAKYGRAPSAPLVLGGVFEDGWVLLRSGGESIAVLALPARLAPVEAVDAADGAGAAVEAAVEAVAGMQDAALAVAVMTGGVDVAGANLQLPAPGPARRDESRRERVFQ
ncbi:MAG TPA: SDR family NAD(P)-dependent oxidoreductase [Actinocrinis sp.]|uniref:SDR family NAD(P)-dependent oxidoreductase n=1 Tax=Actinocrinis sp. TaxID=1920516 RepID=UPI002DDD3A66|nr:SDR family NAD(P)-dependent oxidoreductase [Actinocrinis sp.]HEV2345321.1 SDR family NAD(P)-dependent oxidoreductase [Actinocrinis sp.]